jgi:hypothetical protein
VPARGLSAAGARVVEQHRAARTLRGRKGDPQAEGVTAGNHRQGQRHEGTEQHQRLASDEEGDEAGQQQGAGPEAQEAQAGPPPQSLPRHDDRGSEQGDRQQPAPGVGDDQHHQARERGRPEPERGECSEATA